MVNSRYKRDSNVQITFLPCNSIVSIESLGKDKDEPEYFDITEFTGKSPILMKINIKSKSGSYHKSVAFVVRFFDYASGSGFRGGNWNNNATNLHVSNRNNAANTNANRNNNYGFRSANTYCLFPLPPTNPYLKMTL